MAEDLVPDPGLVGPPPTIYITRAYKLFGFGHQPEYISSTTTSTATLQRCLELLEPDLGVQRTGGTGALHPLNGPAVIDELQAQWIPEWVFSALGRLVVVDASLLGYTPFQVYVQDGIISYHRINRIMPELVDSEYYIFIPSQDGDPLAYEGYPSRMIVNHGDVVHLTPDPAPPQAVQDVQWAFGHFSDWSLTEFADAYDEPTGELRIMALTDRENFLIEAIEGESDALLTQRICAELQVSASGASLVRPSEPFERPMYYQYHLSDIVFLLETPLTGTELVVFVDSRPVLQTFSAIRLRQPRVPVGEAIDLFKIRVEAIEGFRLWLKGGKKRQDWLVAEHRGKFWVKLEAQEVEFTSDYSDSSGTSDDSFSDDAGHGPGPGPPGSFFPEPQADATDDALFSSDADPSDPPREGGSASYHSLCLSRTLPMPDCGQQDATMWNRASGHEAFAQGRQGDTSGCIRCKPTSTVLSATKKRRFPAKHGPCFRLWLFGVTFLTQLQALQAVAGQACHLDPPRPTGGFPACQARQLRDCPGEHFPASAVPVASGSLFHLGALVTLLEEAKDDGFVVVCQFVSDLWCSTVEQSSPSGAPVVLSLEDTIPRTTFQRTVKELQDLLPERFYIAPEQWQDWLDCDLQAVHAACKACPAIWEWLSNFGSWYDDAFDPEAIHIYTDGSACQADGGHTTSASWAFNVWALTATKQAYLGHAFGVTSHAHSPFHLGEAVEDALTGEQLALAWALCWVIEASCAFKDAVFVLHFDSLTAGHGGFGSFRLPSDAGSAAYLPVSQCCGVPTMCPGCLQCDRETCSFSRGLRGQ